jgi:hypothetical protein
VSSKPVGQQPGRQLQRFHPLASYACRNVPLLKYAQGVDAQGYSNAIYSVSVYVTTVITSNVYEFINSREKDTQFNAQDYSNANIQRHCKCYHCDYFKYLWSYTIWKQPIMLPTLKAYINVISFKSLYYWKTSHKSDSSAVCLTNSYSMFHLPPCLLQFSSSHTVVEVRTIVVIAS